MTHFNDNADLVNDNVYTKFGLNRSVRSQDIEQRPHYAGMTEWQKEKMTVSLRVNPVTSTHNQFLKQK